MVIAERKHKSDLFDQMDNVMRIFEKTIKKRHKEAYEQKYPDIVEWNHAVDAKKAAKLEHRLKRNQNEVI